jgi:hypothetical protein
MTWGEELNSLICGGAGIKQKIIDRLRELISYVENALKEFL